MSGSSTRRSAMTPEEARAKIERLVDFHLADIRHIGRRRNDAVVLAGDLLFELASLMQAVGATKELSPQQVDGDVEVMSERWVTPWREVLK